MKAQRTTAEGGTLHWRLTTKGLAGCLIPFLIDWGDAVHPSRLASQGLMLRSLHLEHPAPAPVAVALAALEVDVRAIEDAQPALVATIARASRND